MLRRRHGFTLIELLVVIAIIAILAAMLFPVFARARESARKIQCLSNVKNIATAIQMYLTDYDRFPPDEHREEALEAFQEWTGADFGCGGGSYRARWGNPFLRWPVILDEYVRNRDVWSCPSAKWDPSMWWIVPNYMGDYLKYLAVTHGSLWKFTIVAQEGISPGGNACAWAYPPGWGGTVTDSIGQQAGWVSAGGGPTHQAGSAVGVFSATIGTTSYYNYDRKTSEIGDPAWYVVCGDGTSFGSELIGASTILFEGCGFRCGGADWANCPWSQSCGLATDYWEKFWLQPDARKRFTRHLGGSNIGFADGHAAWWSAEAFLANTNYCGPRPPDCCVTVNPEGKLTGFCGRI